MARVLRPQATGFDLAAVLFLTVAGVAIAADLGVDGTDRVLAMLTAPAVTLPVLWRRTAPLGASAGLALGMVVSGIPTFDQVRCGVAIPAALLVLYALATRTAWREALAGLFLTLAGIAFLAFTDPNLGAGALALFLPLGAGVWGAGRVVAARARAASALHARTVELERQRAQTAQLAVEVERTRLTKELGGAVRERMGEIVALAKLGERELAGDETAARQAFERIETAGRASLDEMRGLLGALRGDGVAGRAPPPTLAQLDTLLARARADGRAVELHVAGHRRTLPEGVELAAYRIVEHALAAAGGGASVRLGFAADALEVEVEVDHRGAEHVVDRPILAAREQVAARGGALVLRPAGPGRRAYCVRLPLVAEHA